MNYFCPMSASEIILILFVYLMLFGAKGVPALAQTLGKAVYQFRNAAKDVQNEIMTGANEFKKQADVRLDQMDVMSDEEHNYNQNVNIPRNKPVTAAPEEPSQTTEPDKENEQNKNSQ